MRLRQCGRARSLRKNLHAKIICGVGNSVGAPVPITIRLGYLQSCEWALLEKRVGPESNSGPLEPEPDARRTGRRRRCTLPTLISHRHLRKPVGSIARCKFLAPSFEFASYPLEREAWPRNSASQITTCRSSRQPCSRSIVTGTSVPPSQCACRMTIIRSRR